MPFGPLFNPSFGLSLLKSALARSDVRVEVRYFTIAFAELVGEPAYSGIALNGEVVARELAGEWVFSRGLFDESPEDVDLYIEDILVKRSAHPSKGRPVSRGLLNQILKARGRAISFLDWCVVEIVRRPPKVLGFTSMFEQHLASLALARRLKQALPDVFILFGGANCEGVMGAGGSCRESRSKTSRACEPGSASPRSFRAGDSRTLREFPTSTSFPIRT
jgi:hypothetical protein